VPNIVCHLNNKKQAFKRITWKTSVIKFDEDGRVPIELKSMVQPIQCLRIVREVAKSEPYVTRVSKHPVSLLITQN